VDAGRETDAVKMLDTAAEKFPKDADVLNFLGYLLAVRGERLDEAVRLVTRALQIDPGNPSYLDSLGWAHFKRGELGDAQKHLSKAAEALPANSVIQDHYGDLLVRIGKPAEAITAWTKALKGDGEDIDKAAIEKKIRNAKFKM
jgi:Flp pilus assembly protein TadD